MVKTQDIKFEESQRAEFEALMKNAETRFPGIDEMLRVYGGYEEMAAQFRRYLEMTQPQSVITTSSHTSPVGDSNADVG